MKIKEILYEDDQQLLGQSGLPRWIEDAFYKVAEDQRDGAEKAMLRVQFKMGGGVLNPVCEHGGDISNRMYKDIKWGEFQRNNVLDKATKCYRWLTTEYGFQREMQENIISNANYRKTDPKILKDEIDRLLLIYANEHSKLPAYNEAQFHAINAAISIGRQEWKDATSHLKYLINLASDENEYNIAVREYEINDQGNLKIYPY